MLTTRFLSQEAKCRLGLFTKAGIYLKFFLSRKWFLSLHVLKNCFPPCSSDWRISTDIFFLFIWV